MPIQYKTVPALTIYYSDSSFPAEKEVGYDPKNVNNVNYIKFNKPYAQYQWLGGLNLKIVQGNFPVPIPAGAVLNFYGDNLTTPTAPGFVYTCVFPSYNGVVPQTHLIMVGMPSLAQFVSGLLEFYGTLTIGSVVYVIGSSFVTLTLP